MDVDTEETLEIPLTPPPTRVAWRGPALMKIGMLVTMMMIPIRIAIAIAMMITTMVCRHHLVQELQRTYPDVKHLSDLDLHH